jgi:hypothetical protein
MLEAQTQFWRIIGHRDLSKLAIAVEREVATKRATNTHTKRPQTTTTTAAPEIAASPT